MTASLSAAPAAAVPMGTGAEGLHVAADAVIISSMHHGTATDSPHALTVPMGTTAQTLETHMTASTKKAPTIGDALVAAKDAGTVKALTTAQAAFAKDVHDALTKVEKAKATLETRGAGLFGTCINGAIKGFSLDLVIQAYPGLKDNKASYGTFRAIKSLLEAAAEEGVSLVDAKGNAKAKKALTLEVDASKYGVDLNGADGKAKDVKTLEKEIKAAKLAAKDEEKDGDGATVAEEKRTATAEEIIAAALSHLETSAEMRAIFGARLATVAEMRDRDVAMAEEKAAADAEARQKAATEVAEALAATIAKNKADYEADLAAAGLTKGEAVTA
jgi:hypothetical protein